MQQFHKTIGEWQQAIDEQLEAVKYSRWLSLLQEYKKHGIKERDIYGFIGTITN